MNQEDKKNHAFRERVLRYQEKSISAEEVQQLNQELRESEENRTEFVRLCETSRLILESSRDMPSSKILRFFNSNRWLGRAGIAAILVICLGLVGLVWNEYRDGQEPVTVQGQSDRWGESVAMVEEFSADAEFTTVNGSEEGALLGKGWFSVEQGWVRLQFRSGAIVTLQAPASFGIDSAMRSYLEYGKVSVYAPESARDFVVATKTMEVVDLGTRFEMEVDFDSGESVVEVAEGLVDLHLGSRGTQRKIQPLEAGWKAKIDEAGRIINMAAREGATGQGKGALLAHWKLDQITEGGVLADSGSKGMVGLFRGDALGRTSSGKVGNALDMGETGYVDLSKHIPSVTELNAFSMSAWIRDPSDKVGILFSFSDGSARNRIQFNLNNKHLVYLWQDQSSHWDSIAGWVEGWTPGQWYHVAVSVDPSGVRLYRDGKLLASGSTGIQIGTSCLGLTDIKNPRDMFLGHVREGTGGTALKPQWFGGVMDDVQFYANALDHSAIQYLYENPGEALPRSAK